MGYKPRVVISDYTIKWFPRKFINYMKNGNKAEKKKALESVEQFRFKNESIVLNEKNLFINEKLKGEHLQRIFNRYKLKYNPEQNIYLLRNVKVISESKASYEI